MSDLGKTWQQVSDKQDFLGPNYRARTFIFAGASQPLVHTTLVQHLGEITSPKAILYIHGYTDYFFQTGLADFFVQLGYRFYALDLQGYGRSLRPYLPPNWCSSIEQYSQDIDIALATLYQDGVRDVSLLAHSTGGLVAASYLSQTINKAEREQHYGLPLADIKHLILNSPFLAMPFAPKTLRLLSKPLPWLLTALSRFSIQAKSPTMYAQTLHTKFAGQWDYRLDWKPAEGYPLSFHWLKQIDIAQRKLSQSKISLPTLLCHSQTSTIGKNSVEAMQQGDGVLDVHSMQEAAEQVFTQLTKASIPKGYHDLYLSQEEAQKAFLLAMQNWLQGLESQTPSANL